MLRVVASERVEPLVEDLARELADRPADPMTPEWIAVGSDGLERWLRLELARHLGADTGRSDGVAANILMTRPGTLRTAVVLAGTDQPEHDPWLPNQLVWAVLETLRAHGPGDERLAVLVDESARSVHRRASQIASRFAAYHLYRPEMIRRWLAGDDVDASGAPLPPGQSWQPYLWRMVREHVGVQSPAERLTRGLDIVRSDPSALVMGDTMLPPRLVFFGPSLLPTGAGFLEVAEAVAEHRDVLVYVIEPSATLSEVLRSRSGEIVARYDRSHDVSARTARHPLLRSWGRLQRETALLLADQPLVTIEPDSPRQDTLLHTLQSQIRANDEPAGAFVHRVDDDSISLHRCFGPTRQVEALKDVLLGLLADPTSTLTEDDIIVACPSLETFAPLLKAHFGPSATSRVGFSGDESPLLRYRITGLPSGLDNPVTEGLLAALHVVGGRFEVDDVTDLLALPAVTNRFRWTQEHLERMNGWLDDTNVRWGIDGEHRAGFDMPSDVASYTWRSALDQLIMGTAVRSASEVTVGDTVPVALAADDPELLGQLAAVLGRLEHLVHLGREPRPVSEWFDIVVDLMDRLLSPDPSAEWQSDSTRRQLLRLVDGSRLATSGNEAGRGRRPDPSPVPIGFGEFVEMFEDVVAEQRGRSDFFRGGVTVTTLNALRNVPAKVVCVLGADQGAFTSGGVDSDDLIGTNPRLGDRDPRAEVRQTLLDALLAARERFIVFSDGTDVRTNTVIPAAVVVSELLDTIDATCAALPAPDPAADRGGRRPRSVSERITIEHPRQPFDESYFDEEAAPGRSFSRASLAAAEQRRRRTTTGGDAHDGDRGLFDVVLTNPVVDTSAELDLEALRGLVRDSTAVFLHDGLGIRLPGEVDVRSTELPLEGDALDDWKLGTQLLEVLADGISPEGWLEKQVGLGNVPPLALARERIDRLVSEASDIVDTATARGVETGRQGAVPIEIDLDDGRRLTGRVRVAPTPDGADTNGERRLVSSMSFSRTRHSQMLTTWIDLLALVATDDSAPWEAIIINRPAKPTKKDPAPAPVVRHVHSGDLDSVTAKTTLTMLAQMYDSAVRRPVPLFPDVFGPDPDVPPRPDDWRSRVRQLSSEVEFVYGDIPLWELTRLTAEGHRLIPSGMPLAEAYADKVWDAFHSTVTVVHGDGVDAEED